MCNGLHRPHARVDNVTHGTRVLEPFNLESAPGLNNGPIGEHTWLASDWALVMKAIDCLSPPGSPRGKKTECIPVRKGARREFEHKDGILVVKALTQEDPLHVTRAIKQVEAARGNKILVLMAPERADCCLEEARGTEST